MANIVRETILENIKTTLEGITVANGYVNTIASVQRWKQSGNLTVDIPCIFISAGPEEKLQSLEQSNNAVQSCNFTVNIEVWTRHDEAVVEGSTDTVLNSLLGDVEKALLVDHTRGGNAEDTKLTGNIPFETVEGLPHVGLIIETQILYRHKRGDLTTKM